MRDVTAQINTLIIGVDPLLVSMTRIQIQTATALSLIVLAALLYTASNTSKTPLASPAISSSSLWAFKMSADHMRQTLKYGANEEAPNFVPQDKRGARILILAYPR